MEKAGILIVAFIFCFAGHARSQKNKEPEKVTTGRASYYAKKFQGRKTANGEEFNNYDYTAAHRKLPFHTYLNVINKNNNFNIIVRVNDRGPYSHNRLIDLSEAAARRIGAYQAGLVPIKMSLMKAAELGADRNSNV